jgi:multiple sugar transport system substrate-binding protein
MIRRLRSFVPVPLLVLLLGSCAQPAPGRIELQFWAMGREGEAVALLLPGFERRHPHIRVELQQLPWTAAHAKLLTAFAADALPDVIQLGNTWVPEFAELDALAPLDEALRASPGVRREDYFPGILDTNVIDGRLYGLPWYVDTRLLYYRRDLLAQAGFDAPPQRWSEWLQMQAAIKAMVGSERYAVLLPLNEFEPLLALALQQDTPLLRDGERYGNFRSADFHQTLSFYAEMFRRDYAPKMTNTQISNVWTEFGRGYFSFYISGPWNIAEFQKRMPAPLQDAWMTAPLPGPNGPGASNAGGSSLVVSKDSLHPESAWALIEYLSEPAVQREFHRLVGGMPPRRSSWDQSALADDVYARAFREQLERAKPTPKVPEWERIATEMRLISERVVHGEISVDQAAVELDARTDRILEKRRWMLDRRVATANAAAAQAKDSPR